MQARKRTGRALILAASSSLAIAAAARAQDFPVLQSGDGANYSVVGNNATLVTSQQYQIIRWDSFSLAQNRNLTVVSGDTNPAAAVDRVAINIVRGGGAPSLINGDISSNQQFWLINPAGIVIGPTSVIDASGVLLTTRSLQGDAIVAGPGANSFRATFVDNGARGVVINNGVINPTERAGDTRRYAILTGAAVRNSGVIGGQRVGGGELRESILHDSVMAAAGGFTVQIDGLASNGLVSFRIDSSVLALPGAPPAGEAAFGALVEQTGQGIISAYGRSLIIDASAANAILDNVINLNGLVRAESATVDVNGAVILGPASIRIDAVGGGVTLGGSVLAQTSADGGVATIDVTSTGDVGVSDGAVVAAEVSGAGAGVETGDAAVSIRSGGNITVGRNALVVARVTEDGTADVELLADKNVTLSSGSETFAIAQTSLSAAQSVGLDSTAGVTIKAGLQPGASPARLLMQNGRPNGGSQGRTAAFAELKSGTADVDISAPSFTMEGFGEVYARFPQVAPGAACGASCSGTATVTVRTTGAFTTRGLSEGGGGNKVYAGDLTEFPRNAGVSTVDIEGGSLSVGDGDQIVAAAAGVASAELKATAGDLDVKTGARVLSAASGAEAVASTMLKAAQTLTLADRSRVSAQTQEDGDATVTLGSTNGAVTIGADSEHAAVVGRDGTADFTIEAAGNITLGREASTANLVMFGLVQGSGSAGMHIRSTGGDVRFVNGVRASANAENQASNTATSTVEGGVIAFERNSSLFAKAGPGGRPKVEATARRDFTMSGGSFFFAETSGAGVARAKVVAANDVALRDSFLYAEVRNGATAPEPTRTTVEAGGALRLLEGDTVFSRHAATPTETRLTAAGDLVIGARNTVRAAAGDAFFDTGTSTWSAALGAPGQHLLRLEGGTVRVEGPRTGLFSGGDLQIVSGDPAGRIELSGGGAGERLVLAPLSAVDGGANSRDILPASTLIAAGAATIQANEIVLTADRLQLLPGAEPALSAAQLLWIRNFSSPTVIALGAAPADDRLVITQAIADLGRAAPTLRVGRADASSPAEIRVEGSLSRGPGATLAIVSAGGVSTVSGAGLQSPFLAVDAATISLTGANTVTEAAFRAVGDLSFASSGAFRLGSAGGLTGAASQNGAITLQSGGLLTIAAPLRTTALARIAAIGGIVAEQDGLADVGSLAADAGLQGVAPASIALTGANRIAGPVALRATGSASLTTADRLLIGAAGGLSGAETGADLSLRSGGALAIEAPVKAGGAASLYAAGDVVSNAAGAVEATRLSVEAASAGAVASRISLGGSNRIGEAVALKAPGDVVFASAAALRIGTVGGVGGASSANGGVSLRSDGDLSIDAPIAAPGTVSLTAAGAVTSSAAIGSATAPVGVLSFEPGTGPRTVDLKGDVYALEAYLNVQDSLKAGGLPGSGYGAFVIVNTLNVSRAPVSARMDVVGSLQGDATASAAANVALGGRPASSIQLLNGCAMGRGCFDSTQRSPVSAEQRQTATFQPRTSFDPAELELELDEPDTGLIDRRYKTPLSNSGNEEIW